jgi:CheY-like chemotaxis protein
MTRILKAHGVTSVHQAYDGQQGIDMVQRIQPDLIILDLMMPNVDGFGVLDRLKVDEALRDVPVIVVTAKDLTGEERARLSGQVQGLLSKGSFIDEDALQHLLNEKLG